MKLRALDQIHVSSVQADSLRPGQEFEVSETLGLQLLKTLPVECVVDAESAEKAAPDHENKAEPAAPANKAASRRDSKNK